MPTAADYSFGALLILFYTGVTVRFSINLYRDLRSKSTEPTKDYYVYCAPKHYPASGFPWSGPYCTEEEARDEIADSKRLVGRHDSLYVVKNPKL